MNDTTKSFEQAAEAILTFEVSDDALETAADAGKDQAANFTLGACTALSVCPE
jgi:hypothetical protein